jgi:hypothetical protein
MNSTAMAAGYVSRSFDGSTVAHEEGWSASECKWINKITAALIKFGAASEERLSKVCRLDLTTIRWALYNLECKQGGGLWTLPG